MTTLLLERHGLSQANQEHFYAGHMDVPLLEAGELQAKQTAEYLVEHFQIDKVYASDLQRAYNTGKAVADLLNQPVIADPQLREIHGGDWEGTAFDTLVEKYPEPYRIWREDIGHAHCTGGESVEQLGVRIQTELTRIAGENDGKTVLIATHATPIRVMQCLVTCGDLARMKDIPWVSNASYSVLYYRDGVWEFGPVSQDAHLGNLKSVFPKNV